MFHRYCERCTSLVLCSRAEDARLVCSSCGGPLLGPVALAPATYRERAEVLLSPHYTGAVAVRTRWSDR